MAGKLCPQCKKNTFFETPKGGKCNKCGYTAKSPPNEGRGGKGKRCPICGNFTVFNGKCTVDGTKFTEGNK